MNPPRPRSLTAVAWLFVLAGVFSAIDIVSEARHARIFINLGVLGIFAGLGLLRFSRSWRTVCLASLWIGVLGCVAGIYGVLSGQADVRTDWWGFALSASYSPMVVGGIIAGMLALQVWMYSVLTRDEVRQRFGISEIRT